MASSLTKTERFILNEVDSCPDKIVRVELLRRATGLTIVGFRRVLNRMIDNRLLANPAHAMITITFGGILALRKGAFAGHADDGLRTGSTPVPSANPSQVAADQCQRANMLPRWRTIHLNHMKQLRRMIRERRQEYSARQCLKAAQRSAVLARRQWQAAA